MINTPHVLPVSKLLKQAMITFLLSLLYFTVVDLLSRNAAEPPTKPGPRYAETLSQYSHNYNLLMFFKDSVVHHCVVRPYHYLHQQADPYTVDPRKAPPWPAPSFHHLLSSAYHLPYSVTYDDTPPTNAPFAVDTEIESSSDGAFPIIDDASDSYIFNLIKFTDDALSLHLAGYNFSFSFDATDQVSVDFNVPISSPVDPIMPDLPQAPMPAVSWSTIATDFLSHFSPAEAARVVIRTWMYS